MEYKVQTRCDKFNIRQDVITSEVKDFANDIEETLMTWILNTKDEGVRTALIKMGWTPPKEVEG